MKHNDLWFALRDLGFGGRLISLIMELYEGQESAVRIEGGVSNHLRCVMEDQRSVEFDGLKINGEVITDLRYADDTALLSGSENGLHTLLHTVKEYSDDKGLKLNVKNTKIMDIRGCQTSSKIT